MINKIKSLLLGTAPDNTPIVDDEEPIRVAAAAVMIEAAIMDGDFDEQERHIISELLGECFDLSPSEVEAVIVAGIEAVENSVELYGFSRTLKNGYEPEQRIKIVEMLWHVSYADGVLHDYEANLVRRLSGLLHVTDRESGDARKRVLERLDIG